MKAAESDFPIAIIGTGFAGIGAAIQLKKQGIDSFTLFERADGVGGTWRDNTYPGAACDVPSHVYSFSFEPNPNWSRAFAESWEIREYLEGLVDKWQLTPHIRFGAEIVEAVFDESAGTWDLSTGDDETFTARAVIVGAGGLVDPSTPDIKGIESFTGEVMHTARWNHDIDLTGRDVAVIGTGASAVQVVPSIAPQVASMSVFQRTPGWVVDKPDKVYSEGEKRLLARFPLLLWLSRTLTYWASEFFGPIVFLDSERLSKIGLRRSMRHLEEQVEDPELREKLKPDFQFGCKRILISNDYWKSFERDNVELVTDPIEQVVADGVETVDGSHYKADALILATGFTLNIATAPFPIRGLGGRSIDDAWRDGAVAYKGMTVSGFPNWFVMMGPNTGPGHTSVLVYTEAQISHALGAIEKLRSEGLKYVNVKQDVQDRYNAGIQKRMKHMVWSTGCNSWYLSADGSNHSLYPGFAAEYVLRARKFAPRDYEMVRF